MTTPKTSREDQDPHRQVSRLPPLPRPLDPMVGALFDDIRSRGGDILNLHLTSSHAPRVSKAKRALTYALRNDCDCPRLYRELAICRAAFLVGCQYELNHHLPLLRRAGLDEKQAEAMVDWRDRSELFDEKQKAVLAYVDEICERRGEVAEATFAALQKCFPSQQIVELTLNATCYYANGLYMKALGVAADAPDRQAAPGAF